MCSIHRRRAAGFPRRPVRPKGRKEQQAPLAEHAVITHLPLSDDELGTGEDREAVHELDDRIRTSVAGVGGDHDGHEFGGGEAVLYTYGPDADVLLHRIRASLGDFPLRAGAYAVKRYGAAADPAARQERVALDEPG